MGKRGLRKTTEQFIEHAKLIHGDKYDYSCTEYISSHEYVQIFCIACDEYFSQRPCDHTNAKHGHRKCSSKRAGAERAFTKEKFIELAKLVHGENFDYSKVIYVNSFTKVEILCRKCKEYFCQIPSQHMRGQGCAKCKNCIKKTKEQFIKEAVRLHGDKYDYSKVDYTNNKAKVEIICKKENKSFWQQPQGHLQGRGCKSCSDKERGYIERLTKEQFVEKSKIMHGDKYDYSRVIYITNSDKVEIICCACVESFWQSPTKHLCGQGCKKCAFKNNGLSCRLTKEQFIERAIKVHGKKYDYSKAIYIGGGNDIEIICNKDGDSFWQTPGNHLQGSDCPRCAHTSISKKEIAWLDYLKVPKKFRKQKIVVINNKRFKPDAIDNKNKIIWEFDGDFWHGNPARVNLNDINNHNKIIFNELYQKTLARNEAYKQAGYTLIQIWESDWNIIKKSLKQKSKRKIKKAA